MLEIVSGFILFAWLFTTYSAYTIGYTKGVATARREFREGLKLLKGGK